MIMRAMSIRSIFAGAIVLEMTVGQIDTGGFVCKADIRQGMIQKETLLKPLSQIRVKSL